MDTQRLKEKLPHILSNLKEIRLLYLFGSQVEGRLGPLSDYDLAVLFDPTGDDGQVHARMSHELACALGTDQVDVVLLNRAPIELAYAIIAQGRVLYQRDVATRVEYEAQVLSRYGDYLPVLRAQRDDIMRGDEDGARVHQARVHRYRAALGRTERTLGQITAAQRQAAE
jgi:predicted nucleotidyltransferase